MTGHFTSYETRANHELATPQCPQLAKPCKRADPSLTAPPALCGPGRVFAASRAWLAS